MHNCLAPLGEFRRTTPELTSNATRTLHPTLEQKNSRVDRAGRTGRISFSIKRTMWMTGQRQAVRQTHHRAPARRTLRLHTGIYILELIALPENPHTLSGSAHWPLQACRPHAPPQTPLPRTTRRRTIAYPIHLISRRLGRIGLHDCTTTI